MDLNSLKDKNLKDLQNIAKDLNIKNIGKLRKQELIDIIIESSNSNIEKVEKPTTNNNTKKEIIVDGILDLHSDGYGFLRSKHFYSGEEDIYVSPTQIRRFKLKTGDFIFGITREKKEGEKFAPLIYVKSVNDYQPDKIPKRPNFESLTPIYPNKRINLEHENCDISNRIIDLVSPIGNGQRGLIVSPPKAGKTTIIKSIAKAIEMNHPDIKVLILLIDERPEEVTDIKRYVNAEVIASTFDELPSNHIKISEIVLERAKRLVEHGKDVVILLDSITRLTRAYNLAQPSSGKILSGGIDPTSFYKPKRFLGAARNIEGGGSLTILASALVDTGSRMDDVIFEEFKGTGNMEIHLDRHLSEMRIYPSIDLEKSGTRKDDLLLNKDEYDAMLKLRKLMVKDSNYGIMNKLLKLFKKTKDNKSLINILLKEQDIS